MWILIHEGNSKGAVCVSYIAAQIPGNERFRKSVRAGYEKAINMVLNIPCNSDFIKFPENLDVIMSERIRMIYRSCVDGSSDH